MFSYQEKLEPIEWRVKVSFPNNNVGGEFLARFAVLDEAEIKQLLENDDELVRAAVVGWEGIEENGKSLEFSSENLTKLIKNRFVKIAIIRAYFEMFREAETKN